MPLVAFINSEPVSAQEAHWPESLLGEKPKLFVLDAVHILQMFHYFTTIFQCPCGLSTVHDTLNSISN